MKGYIIDFVASGSIVVEAESEEQALEIFQTQKGLEVLNEIEKKGYDSTIISEICHQYVIEYCPFCDSDQVIFARGVTACPHCGAPLAPCNMCDECDYSRCPYGCTGTEADAHKPITNPPLTEAFGDSVWKYL